MMDDRGAKVLRIDEIRHMAGSANLGQLRANPAT